MFPHHQNENMLSKYIIKTMKDNQADKLNYVDIRLVIIFHHINPGISISIILMFKSKIPRPCHVV